MPTERRSSSDRIRYRYGICLNDNCTKCKTKEVQQLPIRKEFVCTECNKPLRECPPPRTWWQKNGKMSVLIGLISLAAIVGGLLFFLQGGNADNKPTAMDSTAMDTTTISTTQVDSSNAVMQDTVLPVKNDTVHDTVTVEKTIVKEVAVPVQKDKPHTTTTSPSTTKQPASGGNGTVRLGYGTFKGEVKGGKPNGMGRLTFSSSHVIDSRDPKGRIAESGDYVIGEFSDGHLVQGTWYGSDNVVKGSILIGK